MKQKRSKNKVTFDQHPMESPGDGQDSEESEENGHNPPLINLVTVKTKVAMTQNLSR